MSDPREFLVSRGVEPEAVDAAEHTDELAMLVADQMLFPQQGRFTLAELAREAGIDIETARRFWRALGFPEPPADERIFGEQDVAALRDATADISSPADLDVGVQQARAVAAGLAKVAEVWCDQVREALAAGLSRSQIAGLLAQHLNLPRIGRTLDYVHRRMLQAGLRRAIAPGESGMTSLMTIGYADMVGFTALTHRMEASELTDLLERFEAATYDSITGVNGRFVKMIGDEVLFAADDADTGVAIALALVELEGLPPVRVGLATGPVLVREGDVYGPTVNLGSRIVRTSEPAGVVADQAVCEAMEAGSAVRQEPIGPIDLKDFGPTPLWRLSRAS